MLRLKFNKRPLALGSFLIMLFLLLSWVPAEAHEPIFGIGPHTIHRYGVGLETEFEGGGDDRRVSLEAIFGVTEDLALTFSLPYQLQDEASGWANLLVRGKWRFYRQDGRGRSDQAAVALGVRAPGFQRGPESVGYLFAATIGREARREYFFSGLRYLYNGANAAGVKPGSVFRYDLAVGLRPVPAGYEAPDLVLLLELNGVYTRRSTGSAEAPEGRISPRSGHRIGLGPGLIVTYKNIMLKAGLDFIATEASERVPFGDEVEFVFAVESHLSPFSFVYGR